MKKILGVLGLSLVLVLTGCGSREWGNKNIAQTDIIENLVNTHAGKKMVYIDLGQPADVIHRDNGKETVWVYYNGQTTPNAGAFIPFVEFAVRGNAKGERREIVFDESGKVLSSSKAEIEKVKGLIAPVSLDALESRSDRVKKEMESLKLPYDDWKVTELQWIHEVAE